MSERVSRGKFIKFLVVAGAAAVLPDTLSAVTPQAATPKPGAPQTANFSITEALKPALARVRAQAPTQAVNETIQILEGYDKEASRNILKLEDMAPEISKLVGKEIAREFDVDPNKISDNQFFVSQIRFLEALTSSNVCRLGDTRGAIATVDLLSEQAYLDLFSIASLGMRYRLTPRISHSQPATYAFIVADHEAGHQITKIKSLDPDKPNRFKDGEREATVRWIRGVNQIYTYDDPNKPESDPAGCLSTTEMTIEEAIVEHTNAWLIRRMGQEGYTSESYSSLVARYQRQVIDFLFGGDGTAQAHFRQRSEREEYYAQIGSRLKLKPEYRDTPGATEQSDFEFGHNYMGKWFLGK